MQKQEVHCRHSCCNRSSNGSSWQVPWKVSTNSLLVLPSQICREWIHTILTCWWNHSMTLPGNDRALLMIIYPFSEIWMCLRTLTCQALLTWERERMQLPCQTLAPWAHTTIWIQLQWKLYTEGKTWVAWQTHNQGIVCLEGQALADQGEGMILSLLRAWVWVWVNLVGSSHLHLAFHQLTP